VGGVITLEREWDRALGIRPSVSGVLFDRRGCVLLQQRSDGGQWGLPGGSIEIGESVADAVAREEAPALAYSLLGLLPVGLPPNHRIRIRDARARRIAASVR